MLKEERLPGIRKDIQIIPFMHEGEQVYYIRDILNLCPEGLVLRKPVMEMIMLMMRTRSIRDFQAELVRRQGGTIVSATEVMDFIRNLDELYVLNTRRYREARDHLIKSFEALSVRPAALAGKGYPDKPHALENFLSRYLAQASDTKEIRISDPVKAIIAPHIDLMVGADTYGKVYRYLPRNGIKRIVILGIGHNLHDGYFAVTDKDFQLPNGLLKTDKEAVAFLRSIPGGALAGSDFVHKDEHSIEFQALFIRHLIEDENILCVPILCGAFDSLLKSVDYPTDYLSISAFVSGLREITSDPETLIIAGVDLCHVGPKFGDGIPAEKLENNIRDHDSNILDAVETGDGYKLWLTIQDQGNRYHVCGLSALTTLFALEPHLEGKIVDHQIWHEKATRSAVSYAGAVLWRSTDRTAQINFETFSVSVELP